MLAMALGNGREPQIPGLTRLQQDGPNRPGRCNRRLRAVAGLRRHVSARALVVSALAAGVAGLLVPWALPNRVGITRAVAGSRQSTSSSRAPAAPRAVIARPVPPAGPAPAVASVSIGRSAYSVPVPGSYFGISTEYWALPLFERNQAVFERVLALLHEPGDGPLVLRIGGDSADHSFWNPRPRRMPSWAFALTPSFLARLNALVRRDRVKLIIDLNLVTDTPIVAAEWAHAAETALPHGSIVGFEIGNEPDLYSRRYWATTTGRSPFQMRTLPLNLTPSTYVEDFRAYENVIGESAPDIPLVGPAVAHPRVGLPFISTLIANQRAELGAVTGHLYPYSACVHNRRSSSYPSVAHLLSRQATSAFSTDIAGAVAVAHAAGLKFRLTEFNSVTCGGTAGVSDTFATALWAPDALFTAMRTGADGANLHVRANAINAAFTITRGGLVARPLLYGLLLFNRTLGPQAHLVRLRLSAPRSLDVSAWAVRVRGGRLHVLLIDKGKRSVRFDLHLPASGPATVQRLLAPSARSRSGVTLDGQQLNYQARWIGTPRTETIAPGPRGGYEVTLPSRSAALVGVSIGAPVRTSKHHGRVSVAKHTVLAVRLNRSSKH
jgi:hypothetical protein